MARKEFGQFIVVDDEICHGQPTFKGTRIMVWQVIEMVGDGMAWAQIVADCGGRVSIEAIREALKFTGQVFKNYAHDYAESHEPAA